MSLISDVQYEASKLEFSQKTLRTFGITIGIVLGILGFWFAYLSIYLIVQLIFAALSVFLILFSIFFSKSLDVVYRYWMIFAFTLGWFVSRLLLSILFLFVVTPIGIIAQLIKKEFLNISYGKNQSTFWIQKTSEKINYDKMY